MARDEEGFTLIELLLVIAILGIIIVPLGASILIGFRTTDATANRLEGTHDAQLASIWIPADLQSAGDEPGDAQVSPPGNGACSQAPSMLTTKWRSEESLGVIHSYEADYAFTATPGGTTQLARYYCVDGFQQTRTILARNLDPSSPGSATSEGRSVTVTLTEAGISRDPSTYTYSITGTRRTP